MVGYWHSSAVMSPLKITKGGKKSRSKQSFGMSGGVTLPSMIHRYDVDSSARCQYFERLHRMIFDVSSSWKQITGLMEDHCLTCIIYHLFITFAVALPAIRPPPNHSMEKLRGPFSTEVERIKTLYSWFLPNFTECKGTRWPGISDDMFCGRRNLHHTKATWSQIGLAPAKSTNKPRHEWHAERFGMFVTQRVGDNFQTMA